MLKLIVNADDFGFNQNINDAIIESFRNGILRAASLMANGESFDHAVNLIKSNPDLDIGVHLSLTDGKPILNPSNLGSLVNQNGDFYKNVYRFSKNYFLGKVSIQDIIQELSAQIEKILDYGIKISHADSHQHVHMLPRILDEVIQLANRYEIKFIRVPMEKFSSYMFYYPSSILRITQMIPLNYLCSEAIGIKVIRTDHFKGFYFGGRLSKENLLTVINNLPPDGICELMCHPGLIDYTVNHFNGNYRKVNEMIALVDEDVKNALLHRNIQITAFKNLLTDKS